MILKFCGIPRMRNRLASHNHHQHQPIHSSTSTLKMQILLIFIIALILGTKAQIHFPGGRPSSNSGDIFQRLEQGCSVRGEVCRPAVFCAGKSSNGNRRRKRSCRLSDGSPGLCCRDTTSNNVRSFFPDPEEPGPPIGNDLSNFQVRTAFVFGESFASNVTRAVNRETRQAPRFSSTFSHSQLMKRRDGVEELTKLSLASMDAARRLKSGNNLGLRGADISNTILDSECPYKFPPRCNFGSKYRDPSGACNNLRQPLYGMSLTPLQRILPNAYFDGYNEPRRNFNGGELPSARMVSSRLTKVSSRPSPKFTVLLMVMGQFIDHDITNVPVFSGENREPLDCCGFSRNVIDRVTPGCFPIIIPRGDQTFRSRTCLNFVRSMSGPRLDCAPGPTEQVNQITHWLDSSNVYGSNKEEEARVRSFRNGRLRMVSGRKLPNTREHEECVDPNNCFLAGDPRVNEQPSLTVMHTLWAREHNRIASKLQGIYPEWSDEQLYRESRRILNAEWQHVIYNEWLPIVLGDNLMTTFGLWTLSDGYSKDYRDDFDPRINNEFAAAAFRFGHSMVPGIIMTFARAGRRLTGTRRLQFNFNDPKMLKIPGMIDELLKGFTQQEVEEFDNHFADDILNHLFETRNNDDGMDLVAMNIQRARDHGIPGYVQYRKICGVGDANSFEDLGNTMSREKIEMLRRVYGRVEDIDLYAGMIMEEPYRDSFVGQTFLCLIGDQFARLKKGDRFFYDLGGQAGSFTPEQLREIRKASLARIICDNSDGIVDIQPLALLQVNSDYNSLAPCQDTVTIPQVDIQRAW